MERMSKSKDNSVFFFNEIFSHFLKMTGIMWGLSWDIRRLAAGYLEAILGLCNIAERELDKVLSLDCYKQLFTFVPDHSLAVRINKKLEVQYVQYVQFVCSRQYS